MPIRTRPFIGVPKKLFDAAGQLLYSTAAGVIAKLSHPGVAGKVLKTTLTSIEWADESGGGGGSFTPGDYGSMQGGFLRKNQYATNGAEWVKGFGYPASFVTDPGPFNLVDGAQIQFLIDEGLVTFQVDAVDVVDITAVTPAELVTIVNDAGESIRARVIATDRVEFFLATSTARNPSSSMFIQSIDPSMQMEFGLEPGSYTYGSGALAPEITTSIGPWDFGGGGNLTIEGDDGLWFQANLAGSMDAAAVIAAIESVPGFTTSGLAVDDAGDGSLIFTRHSGSKYSYVRVYGNTSTFGFSDKTEYGTGGSYDEDVLGSGYQFPDGIVTIATYKQTSNTSWEDVGGFSLSLDGFSEVVIEAAATREGSNGTFDVRLINYTDDPTGSSPIWSQSFTTAAMATERAVLTAPAGKKEYRLQVRRSGDAGQTGTLFLTMIQLFM